MDHPELYQPITLISSCWDPEARQPEEFLLHSGALDWLADCQPRWKLASLRFTGANSVTHFEKCCLLLQSEYSECCWHIRQRTVNHFHFPKKNAHRGFFHRVLFSASFRNRLSNAGISIGPELPAVVGFAETDAVSIRPSCQTAAGLGAPALPVKGGLKNTTKDRGACIYTNHWARCLICDFGAFVIHWASSFPTVLASRLDTAEATR